MKTSLIFALLLCATLYSCFDISSNPTQPHDNATPPAQYFHATFSENGKKSAIEGTNLRLSSSIWDGTKSIIVNDSIYISFGYWNKDIAVGKYIMRYSSLEHNTNPCYRSQYYPAYDSLNHREDIEILEVTSSYIRARFSKLTFGCDTDVKFHTASLESATLLVHR